MWNGNIHYKGQEISKIYKKKGKKTHNGTTHRKISEISCKNVNGFLRDVIYEHFLKQIVFIYFQPKKDNIYFFILSGL